MSNSFELIRIPFHSSKEVVFYLPGSISSELNRVLIISRFPSTELKTKTSRYFDVLVSEELINLTVSAK